MRFHSRHGTHGRILSSLATQTKHFEACSTYTMPAQVVVAKRLTDQDARIHHLAVPLARTYTIRYDIMQ